MHICTDKDLGAHAEADDDDARTSLEDGRLTPSSSTAPTVTQERGSMTNTLGHGAASETLLI